LGLLIWALKLTIGYMTRLASMAYMLT
jgi:hypothetical protein